MRNLIIVLRILNEVIDLFEALLLLFKELIIIVGNYLG